MRLQMPEGETRYPQVPDCVFDVNPSGHVTDSAQDTFRKDYCTAILAAAECASYYGCTTLIHWRDDPTGRASVSELCQALNTCIANRGMAVSSGRPRQRGRPHCGRRKGASAANCAARMRVRRANRSSGAELTDYVTQNG
ncbi:hypothetical protein C8Q77DRAFT_701944 [Trametes polyzona]|nr:hypothetical protein C8Q77DRAFT_701944 [Trametes polyzona]